MLTKHLFAAVLPSLSSLTLFIPLVVLVVVLTPSANPVILLQTTAFSKTSQSVLQADLCSHQSFHAQIANRQSVNILRSSAKWPICVELDVKPDAIISSLPFFSCQSVNQSKVIFQAMKNNYNIINVTALERLPEKHYAHKNWSPEQNNNTNNNT